jgi:hypothetical protein
MGAFPRAALVVDGLITYVQCHICHLVASGISGYPHHIEASYSKKVKGRMAMKKYMIEREIPKVGTLGKEQLQQAAAKSNEALRQLGPNIQWLESYVADDKTFCVYMAKDEEVIRQHAELSGFPATKITELGKVIDPSTAADRA